MAVLLARKENNQQVLINLIQSGAHKFVAGSYNLDTAEGLELNEICDLFYDECEFFKLSESAEVIAMHYPERLGETTEADLTKVNPFCTALIVSALNGVILKTGKYSELEAQSEELSHNMTELKLAVAWSK